MRWRHVVTMVDVLHATFSELLRECGLKATAGSPYEKIIEASLDTKTNFKYHLAVTTDERKNYALWLENPDNQIDGHLIVRTENHQFRIFNSSDSRIKYPVIVYPVDFPIFDTRI